MAYTTIDKPSDYFNTVLYTGTGNSHAITNVGFAPDWVWLKKRSGSENHILTDSVRGATKTIRSNTTDAENTESEYLKSFDSDGFTLGTRSEPNGSGATFASWNWKAGTSFTNDASATGIGTIDSTGSVSDTSGFSIVSYTGTGSNGTIKHGLSTVPKIMIVKERDNANNWFVYHYSLGATKQLILQETDAEASFTATWNDTEPTSSVFSVGTSNGTNRSGGGLIAYIFSERKGYSKFGSYTGNGNADGPMIVTGMKPAWVMAKRTDSANGWMMFDNKRSSLTVPGNPHNELFNANTNDAEGTTNYIDILSNGWKIRSTDGALNGSGGSYIYICFAESPFVTSTGVPATAR